MSKGTGKPPDPPSAKREPFNPSRKICGFYPPDIVGRNTDLKLTDGQKRLYERAVRWAGRTGEFWYGFLTIAEALGKSVRQVKDDMAALEEKGLIAHVRRRRQTNLYRFLRHPIFEVQSTAYQESALEVHDSVLEVQDSVKKGPLEVQSTAHELCNKKNYVKENYIHPPISSRVSDRNADVRVPLSRQLPASEDRAALAVTVSQNTAAPDLFREFMGVFLAAGKLLNDRDTERALRLWLNFDEPEYPIILAHLKRSVVDGTWSDARYVPMPVNYLESKAWTRVGPGRVLPSPAQSESKAESAQRRAAARFLRGDR